MSRMSVHQLYRLAVGVKAHLDRSSGHSFYGFHGRKIWGQLTFLMRCFSITGAEHRGHATESLTDRHHYRYHLQHVLPDSRRFRILLDDLPSAFHLTSSRLTHALIHRLQRVIEPFTRRRIFLSRAGNLLHLVSFRRDSASARG